MSSGNCPRYLGQMPGEKYRQASPCNREALCVHVPPASATHLFSMFLQSGAGIPGVLLMYTHPQR